MTFASSTSIALADVIATAPDTAALVIVPTNYFIRHGKLIHHRPNLLLIHFISSTMKMTDHRSNLLLIKLIS